jgi:glycosyltransferase involved in cell wall biosynthesis
VSVFVSEPDNGQNDAINKGMSRATGEILCWINGGDFFIPGAIENAVSVFAASPTAEWITGRPAAEGLALRRQGSHEVVVSDPEIRGGLCCGGATGFRQQEGMFWRRTLWERAGALDTGLRLAADYELRIRFARETDLVRLTNPLAAFSYHETNRSIVEHEAILSACPVFLVSNQFWKHKDHALVVEALSHLKEEGISVPVVFTGALRDYRGSDHVDHFLQSIQRKGIHDFVHLLGFLEREERLHLMRSAFAMIQLSRFEGLSTVVYDCKAIGQRLILSDLAVHWEQKPSHSDFFPSVIRFDSRKR